jgi:hypothetical protein
MVKSNETVLLGWCDNGTTDGKFTEGLVGVFVSGPSNSINLTSAIRVEGNQIGRQRQVLFDHWADNVKTDWLLWVDSDIKVNVQILKKLWEVADSQERPIVSGTYFVSKETDGSLMIPLPVLFNDVDGDEFKISYCHPLPKDTLLMCDSAGMGLVLMHKSIVSKLREQYPNQSLFAEKEGIGTEYISEDVSFFRKVKKVGIPLYAHTGAIATHIKRFNLDLDYYNLYWNSKA